MGNGNIHILHIFGRNKRSDTKEDHSGSGSGGGSGLHGRLDRLEKSQEEFKAEVKTDFIKTYKFIVGAALLASSVLVYTMDVKIGYTNKTIDEVKVDIRTQSKKLDDGYKDLNDKAESRHNVLLKMIVNSNKKSDEK